MGQVMYELAGIPVFNECDGYIRQIRFRGGCRIEVCISIHFQKIIDRKVIFWAFVLNDVAASEYAGNILPDGLASIQYIWRKS